MNHRFLTGSAAVALAIGLAFAGPALAQAPAPAADQTPAPPPHPMVGPVMFSGYVDAGTSVNFDSPANNYNFGELFEDRANSFRMNQLVLEAEKDLDPAATGMDWGFKVEGLYGTDARYTHSIGLWSLETHSPYQFDFVEFNAQAHVPVIATGGIDFKAGIYTTPIGYEVVNATGNFFYSHNYITNFAIPIKHTGILSTTHVNDLLDLWLGVDTGINGFLPTHSGDNNSSEAVLAGFGINNPIPNMTILALAHVGAEDPYNKSNSSQYFSGAGKAQDGNRHTRQIFDVTSTYKINDSWSVANETTFDKDDLGVENCANRLTCHSGATAEGTAFYGIYTLNDQWSFGARGEIFRDDQGFYVAGFGSAQDFMRVEQASGAGPNTVYAPGKATYGDLTIGANYKPPLPPLPLNAGLTIRPEFRWDHAWGTPGSNKQFSMNSAGVNTSNDSYLFSVDAIFGF